MCCKACPSGMDCFLALCLLVFLHLGKVRAFGIRGFLRIPQKGGDLAQGSSQFGMVTSQNSEGLKRGFSFRKRW